MAKIKKREEATKIADEVKDLMTKYLESWTFTQSHMKSNLIYTVQFHIEAKITTLLNKLDKGEAKAKPVMPSSDSNKPNSQP